MEGTEAFSMGVSVGVDLGQKMDPTALVVMEAQRRGWEWRYAPDDAAGVLGKARRWRTGGEVHYVARMVQRLPLGTTYPEVARRLAEMDCRLRAMGHYPIFWVDATGVGKPVVDLLRARGVSLRAVYLTGSDQVTEGPDGEVRLGKALLVSRLQVLLQSEQIHLPVTPEAAVLVQELMNYEIRVNESANAQFGAFKVGSHDDLATALGLACWEEQGLGGSSATIPPVDVIEEADRGGW